MITSIEIQNVQSHRKTRLELSPGINIITGDSDAGKSGSRRALRWNFENAPDGDFHLSDWNKKGKNDTLIEESSCTVRFDDGQFVTRVRDSKTNGYVYNGNTLGAIGRGSVPSEVLDVWRMNDANFSAQHDPPFLLDIPPSHAAEYLNRIVRLDRIDTVLDRTEAQRRTTSRELTRAEDNVKGTREEVAKLEWVDETTRAVDTLLERQEALRGLKIDMDDLEAQVATLGVVARDLGALNTILTSVEDPMARVEASVSRYLSLGEDIRELTGLIEKQTWVVERLTRNRHALATTEGPMGDAQDLLTRDKDLCQQIAELDTLVTRGKQIRREIIKYPDVPNSLEALTQGIKKAESLEDITKDIRDLRGYIEDIQGIRRQIRGMVVEQETVEQAIAEALQNGCPVCGAVHGEGDHR